MVAIFAYSCLSFGLAEVIFSFLTALSSLITVSFWVIWVISSSVLWGLNLFTFVFCFPFRFSKVSAISLFPIPPKIM